MDSLSRREFLGACAGAVAGAAVAASVGAQERGGSVAGFEGRFISGTGDTRYLELLDISYRMLYPDPELQNISMLYSPAWNGFVEGPTWGAWWIQNSYGPTYCALPFFLEPYTTFIENAQDLWFSQMGDGKRVGAMNWVAPDGCLCDAAAPGWIVYRQGDGRIDIHDWGMEFTAAGVVMQSELLLISRDEAKIAHYLPMLERSADFIESRRDPHNNLFLAGPAGNLLAPSYTGQKMPDGTYGMAYLAGLSVTYIAGLDRLIELERLAGRDERAALYRRRRDTAARGLSALTTDEGYLIKYLDPDGTRHGVYGAPVHGYFEAVCNHDAVAFRVVDDDQAGSIYRKMASIPGLRPHDLIITNYPSLDDMYEQPQGLWGFGTWVNGGHWTTCEARMVLGYYRLGMFDDARRSMEAILAFARDFRLDNPLVDFGGAPYQPGQPTNCVYDSWGAPTAMLRGLFEYLYASDKLTLIPHIPPGIERLEQRFPVRFGSKRLYLSTVGVGGVTSVWVNGRRLPTHDADTVTVAYSDISDLSRIVICLGGAEPSPPAAAARDELRVPPSADAFWDSSDLLGQDTGNGRPLRIGADSNGEHRFVGEMRRARLWSRALSPEEIATLAKDAAAMLPDATGLVADYQLGHMADGTVANAAGDWLPAKAIGTVTPAADAVTLDGSAYLEVPVDPRLNLVEAYTLDAWIRPERLPDGGVRIIDRVTAGIDDGYLLDTCPSNSLRLITMQGVVSFDAQLKLGEWVHVAGTFDAIQGLALYLNGQPVASAPPKSAQANGDLARVGRFYAALRAAGLGDTYEAAHGRLVVGYLYAIHGRAALKAQSKLVPLKTASQSAADRSYIEAAQRLADGLGRVLATYDDSDDPRKKRIAQLWEEAGA